MDTSLGNDAPATLPGRYRTACTIAAMVVMAAFAKDALPALGWTIPATTIKHEAPPILMPPATAPRRMTVKRIKSGLASWYGKMLQGRPTASGRPFDMNELTGRSEEDTSELQSRGD